MKMLLPALAAAIALLTPAAVAVTCDDVYSDPSWFNLRNNDRCYYTGYPGFANTAQNWTNAEPACKSMMSYQGAQGRLAIIPDDEAFVHIMRNWLESKYGQLDDNFGWWIGLLQTDTSDEPAGGWNWMNNDGKSINETGTGTVYWHSGQPDNAYNGEDCGALWYRSVDDSMAIDDVECSNSRWFICEIYVGYN